MSPRTTLTRLGIAAATTALSVGAVTPALASPADDDWGSSWNQQQQNSQSSQNNQSSQSNQSNQNSQNNDGGGQQQSNNSWNQQNNNQQSNNQQSNNSSWGQHNTSSNSNTVLYKGIVTANGGLRLRSAPNRGSAIIRVVPKGAIVNIFCKTGGENVDGNSLWYLLTDGTWAWGAARYIDNIGAAPRFC
ncbi:SH3 domain-containing protein [Streptomyces sp. SID12501]|uniref:SH3 domain-containing protein n=1 Tax=Streptomyces sp. SID12501 TaxID=2706042 RepID=A0A6B3C5C7_9ACTN|nr:SH3 domain-containing protein [Streptomyces sp. SID12501]NEC92007.1 SH3 domain-containing protein [Streptomyces sp. SID12501]